MKNLKKLISTVAALAIAATSTFTAFAAFPDVADTADYKVAVDNIAALGIVSGDENGNFNPEKEITRAEVTKMIVGTMGPKRMAAAEASMGVNTFDDVPAGHWATGYIAQGVSAGFINGVGGNNFDPSSNVTFAQVVKMLVCVLGYGDDAELVGGWPNGYVSEGGRLGVTDGVNAGANEAVSRAEVATLINNALDIPIKSIIGYENGIAVDENGQVYTTQIPETEVLDGKKGRDYETLLTYYFDAYTVRGRITSTDKKNEGLVSYDVEYSENFDDEVVDPTVKDFEPVTVDAYYPAGVDVDSMLSAYTDAIIMENEDGDWEIISIASYGKNEVVELAADLYDDGTFATGTMEFFKSETSSKTDEYDLDEDVKVYVNGALVKNADEADVVEEYLAFPTTVVKLVNTPEMGSKTIDSDFDYVMLSVYVTAVVDEVYMEEDGEEASIYLEKFNIIEASEIELDFTAVEEGEAEYTIADVDGNEVAVADLQKNDVLTIYTKIYENENLSDLSYIDIVVSRNVVTGKVMSEDTENDKYEVADTMYAFAIANSEGLNVGDEYTLYLDKFGMIAKSEISAASVNYGILNRTVTSNGDEKVRLVTADGSIVTYEAKSADDFKDAEDILDAAAGKDFTEVYDQLIVTYKVNSSDKIYSIKSVADLEKGTFDITGEGAEFNERSAKVGTAKMSDLTKIVDYSRVLAKSTWSGNISSYVGSATLDSFVDGEEYTVVYGGEKLTDGTFPFVVVVEGGAALAPATRFVVVESTGNAVNEDGIEYPSAVVFEGREEKTIFFDVDTDVKKGDVIVYAVNGDGLVEEYEVLFNVNDEEITTLDYLADVDYDADAEKYGSVVVLDDFVVESWNDSKAEKEKNVTLGYGALIEKTDKYIVVGTVADGVTATYSDVDFASDVNVYVYDQGVKYDKLSAGVVSNLVPTKIADKYIVDDEDGNEIYDWAEAGKEAVNTVFFKTFEDEITDIVIVKPAK